MKAAGFPKCERIVSRKLVEELFTRGNSRALAAFPLRLVYMIREHLPGEEPVQVLVSVPKKKLHHAVDRNRVKRQVREAYRLNKSVLLETLPPDRRLFVAFVWLDDHLSPSAVVEGRVRNLLQRASEAVQKQQ